MRFNSSGKDIVHISKRVGIETFYKQMITATSVPYGGCNRSGHGITITGLAVASVRLKAGSNSF